MLTTIATLYENNSKEVHRFVKFALVGALGAIIDFGLLNILHGTYHWDLFWANTISTGAAIMSNFVWNRLWTFPESRSRKKRKQLPQFFLVNIIGLFLNTLIVVGLNAVLLPLVGTPLSYNIAKVIAIGLTLFWNFGVNRIWTYRGL